MSNVWRSNDGMPNMQKASREEDSFVPLNIDQCVFKKDFNILWLIILAEKIENVDSYTGTLFRYNNL